ncbi:MAG: hypothetical protein HRT71_09950 [Flavobacteriales bacterium]|nr:hypothetical protein [Flavobacteriales bacterium]
MNPLVIKTFLTGLKKVFSNKYVLLTIAALFVLFLTRNKIKKIFIKRNEDKFDKEETEDFNQIAQQYRSASNPSGIEFLIDADGTDEEAIERLAYQTKGNFQQIADGYNMKFDETLTDRMRKELDSDEFQQWYNIIL